MPTLENAFALGTLVRIDPKSESAEFRISCGWHYAPKRKIDARLWKVSLRHLTFGWESDLANPAASNAFVQSISLTTWEHRAEKRGWSGTLRLPKRDGDLSNGPTTDICAGTAG